MSLFWVFVVGVLGGGIGGFVGMVFYAMFARSGTLSICDIFDQCEEAYGQGYTDAETHWREQLALIDAARSTEEAAS